MTERKKTTRKPKVRSEPKEESIVIREDLMDGVVIREDGNALVYVMDGGTRRPLASVDAFLACGFGWGQIRVLSPAETETIPIGPEVTGPGDLNP